MARSNLLTGRFIQMMSLTFSLFTQMSVFLPHGLLVSKYLQILILHFLSCKCTFQLYQSLYSAVSGKNVLAQIIMKSCSSALTFGHKMLVDLHILSYLTSKSCEEPCFDKGKSLHKIPFPCLVLDQSKIKLLQHKEKW